jgi:hypothetical protein
MIDRGYISRHKLCQSKQEVSDLWILHTARIAWQLQRLKEYSVTYEVELQKIEQNPSAM